MHATWKMDRTRILTLDESKRVLADLRRRGRRSINSRQNCVIFRLATFAGLRASEIAGLRIGHLHLGIERPFIQLPKAICKGNKARRVPLDWDAQTCSDLTAWRDERRAGGAKKSDHFVCMLAKGLHGQPLSRFCVRDRFRTACRCLGSDRLEGLTVHHGRHTFVSVALHVGRSVAAVRDAAGHSNLGTTNIYAHLIDDDNAHIPDLLPLNGE
ncbi:hypothetical protein LCGC14_0898320 [marine sediment metagenome]|uniref:Tyr recombinase domain-containing protein n=1 Tax=marine sediment metagenome TaxID=412755 RepID=A0A0F9NX35_9ZZZZ